MGKVVAARQAVDGLADANVGLAGERALRALAAHGEAGPGVPRHALLTDGLAGEVGIGGHVNDGINHSWRDRLERACSSEDVAATQRIERPRQLAQGIERLLAPILAPAHQQFGDHAPGVGQRIQAKLQRDRDVLLASQRNDEGAGLDELGDFIVLIPGHGQQQRLNHTQAQAADQNALARRPLQRLERARRPLHRCVEEGEQRANLAPSTPLAVEVQRQLARQPCRLCAAHALVQRRLVRRQAHAVFQRGVEVVQQVQHGMRCGAGRQLTILTQLVQFTLHGVGPLVRVNEQIAVARAATVILKLRPQV